MTRSTLTYEEVKTVAESLTKSGEKPTINRVKEALEGAGSPVTISRFLKQWKNTQEGDAPKPEKKPAAPKMQTVETVEIGPAVKKSPEAPKLEKKSDTNKTDHSKKDEDADRKSERKPQDRREADRRKDRPHRDGQQNQPRGQNNKQGRRNNNPGRRDDRRNGNHNNSQKGNNYRQPYDKDQTVPEASSTLDYLDYYTVEHLETREENELVTIVRRLESMLVKEQSRREVAEKLAQEAKEYADSIKEQVTKRLNDLKQMHDTTVEQLKQEAKEVKVSVEKDLDFYREQLGLANEKLIKLTEGDDVSLLKSTDSATDK